MDSKPLTLVMDPQVQLTADQRTAYDAAAMELHGAQQNAMPTVATLTALMGEVNRAATKLDSRRRRRTV